MKNYSEMCDKLSDALRNYLLFFSITLFVVILIPEILLINPSNINSFLSQEKLMNILLVAIVPIMNIAVAFLSSWFVHLDFHLRLEAITFKFRRRTDDIIIDSLTERCQAAKCEHRRKVTRNPKMVMRHFYFLEDTLKPDLTQVFDRWMRYYLNLYICLFSICFMVLCAVLYWGFTASPQLLISGAIFLLFLVIAIGNILQLRLKLEELATSSVNRLFIWNEVEVLKNILAVCQIKESQCPWKKVLPKMTR